MRALGWELSRGGSSAASGGHLKGPFPDICPPLPHEAQAEAGENWQGHWSGVSCPGEKAGDPECPGALEHAALLRLSWRQPPRPPLQRALLSSWRGHATPVPPEGQPQGGGESFIRAPLPRPGPQSISLEQMGVGSATRRDHQLCPRGPAGRAEGLERSRLAWLPALLPRDPLRAGLPVPAGATRPQTQEAVGQGPSPSSDCHRPMGLRKAKPSGHITDTPLLWPVQAHPAVETGAGERPFCRALAGTSRGGLTPPHTQKALDLDLVFWGKPRGLSELWGRELAL